MRPHFVPISVVVIIFAVQWSCDGCVIRTCPRPGGKRSDMPIIPEDGMRECMRCMGQGYCVGADACCGTFGCVMGSPETEICRKEAKNPNPCVVPIARNDCGESGSCYADSICCDNNSCTVDPTCRKPSSSGFQKDISADRLAKLIERILARKNGK